MVWWHGHSCTGGAGAGCGADACGDVAASGGAGGGACADGTGAGGVVVVLTLVGGMREMSW